jgi:hypothetical protein
MFRQVVGTTFQLMGQYQEYWMNIKGSRDVPSLGEVEGQEAEPFDIDHGSLIDYFKVGMKNFSGVWQNILTENDFRIISDLARIDRFEDFILPIESWVRIVYHYAGSFNETPRQRFKVLDTMIPLYYARIASLVNELKDKEPKEAEEHFEAQAQAFEGMKEYMIGLWKSKGGQ